MLWWERQVIELAAKFKKLIKPAIFLAVVAIVVLIVFISQKIGSSGKRLEIEMPDSYKDKVITSGFNQYDGEDFVPIDKESITLPEDYRYVCESDLFYMYLKKQTVSIILVDKKTGAILESTLSDEKDDGANNKAWNGYMKSGVVVDAIIGTVNTYQVNLVNDKTELDYDMRDDGFSVKIYFSKYEFGFTLDVTLNDGDLLVTIPDESIVEDREGVYISKINVFPFFGYTHNDEQDGYMLIPDGNGALIYLDDKEGQFTTGFSQLIYGDDAGLSTETGVTSLLWDKFDTVNDTNKVIAPVFGMAHTEDGLGYLAIVESGDERCFIEAHPNGVFVDYNRSFPKWLFRVRYVQRWNQSNSGTMISVEKDRLHNDLTVRYLLLNEEDANYSGMAVAYRNYLLGNGLIEEKDTSYNTRVDFLGTDREEFLFTTKDVTVTTVDNIETMYAEFKEAGVESLLTVFKGWQKGGLYDVPINSFKADSNIGGTSALKDLINESEKDNYRIYLYNDALRSNADTNSTTYNVIKKVNKRTFSEKYNAEVYDTFYYLTPFKTNETLLKFLDSYLKKEVDNIALSGISDNIFSFYYKGNYYSRTETMKAFLASAAELSDKADIIMEQPLSYMWNYTDAFLDMPLSTSAYVYVDEEVPFMSMVLKGIVPMYSNYVNFEANKTEFFLKMVEAGVFPSFYITYENSSALIYTNSSDLYSTEYKTYKDTIVEYDKELRAVNEAVAGSLIVNRTKTESGMVIVTYDNGKKIYINYTSAELSENGIKVPAMSYKVGE